MPFDAHLDEVLAEVAAIARPAAANGAVANYIPSLAGADADKFAIAVVELDGTEHVVGDADEVFSIQSISKVFALVLAMQKAHERGGIGQELWQRIGVEPSGDPFNSLVQLEYEEGRPRNPLINAGALVVDDLLVEHCDDPLAHLQALLSELAGAPVEIDENVANEEEVGGHRNRAMAHLMESFGNLRHSVDDVLATYFKQCAMLMSTRQLARAARFLANDGVDPASGRQIIKPRMAQRVAAIMFTCGTYDSAGQFAFDVGIPCKSGVAGAIIGVVDGRGALCVWSPPLEKSGNSVAGHVALRELSERLQLSRV